MPLVFRYSDPGGSEEPATLVDLGNTTTTVRLGGLGLAQSAEIGEAATSGIEIDDPQGSLDLQGYRGFRVEETSAPSNSRWIWTGVIGDQKIRRSQAPDGSLRLDVMRVWDIDLIDQNWSLSLSVITDTDGNRPRESAGDRLRWLVASAYSRFDDYGHVTYPSYMMDANDYRDQTAKEVIADCAQEGGYLYWCDRPEAQNHAELWFIAPDSSVNTSAVTISNDLADLDPAAIANGTATVFPPSMSAEVGRSPTRIAYRVVVPYANGRDVEINPVTGAQFAYIDRVAPLANVKTRAKARRVGLKFLADNDEQDERATFEIKVRANQVNDLRHGQRTTVKLTHVPGWETGRACRILQRAVFQDAAGGEAWYRIGYEAVPVAPPASCSTAVSSAVTAAVSNQAYVAPGTISTPITPVSGVDTLIIATVATQNNNVPTDTDLVGTGGFTTEYESNVTVGHPDMAQIWKAIASASGSYNVTASYTPGFSPTDASKWGVAAAAIRTGATSPVQSKGGTGPGIVSATLDSPPTAGNMLIMSVASRTTATVNWPSDNLIPNDGRWVNLGQAYAKTGLDRMELLARCVQDGDTSTYGAGIPGAGKYAVVAVSEWEIS